MVLTRYQLFRAKCSTRYARRGEDDGGDEARTLLSANDLRAFFVVLGFLVCCRLCSKSGQLPLSSALQTSIFCLSLIFRDVSGIARQSKITTIPQPRSSAQSGRLIGCPLLHSSFRLADIHMKPRSSSAPISDGRVPQDGTRPSEI
jgi:hypothetical protein